MPGAAVKLDAAVRVLPLVQVADALMVWATNTTDNYLRLLPADDNRGQGVQMTKTSDGLPAARGD
jgi:hypothetical protein